MTAEFRYMMHLAGCAALGKTPEEPPEGLDWEAVLQFANEQTVLTLVQYAVKTAPFAIPEEIRKSASARLQQTAMQALIRRIGVLRVLGELEKQGITAAVIKGFAIARDYAQPDVRISGDADIYIDEKDEKQALTVFEQFGFSYTPRGRTEKDTILTHPKYGVVELHVSLFGRLIHQIWHREESFVLAEPYQQVQTEDGAYNMLGGTDHFLFVLEHMMKHFIIDGMSLKMLMDVGVLWVNHRDTLDCERIGKFLEQRKYQTAVYIFHHILFRYCGFPLETLQDEWKEALQVGETAVLEDMEHRGVSGFKIEDSYNQRDALRIYNAAVQKKAGSFGGWGLVDTESLLRAIFPPVAVMKEKYPQMKKAGFLYPVAWLHRLVVRGCYHLRKQDIEAKNWCLSVDEGKLEPSIGTRRAELFRMLEMM